jgi:hypothetical protein
LRLDNVLQQTGAEPGDAERGEGNDHIRMGVRQAASSIRLMAATRRTDSG